MRKINDAIFNLWSRNKMITFDIVIIFLVYYCLLSSQGTIYYERFRNITFVIDALSLACIVLCFWHKKDTIKNMDINSYTAIWIFLCLCFFICGYYKKESYFIIFGMTTLFVAINNKKKSEFLSALCKGSIYSFFILEIGALFFRPLNTHIYYGGRYSGVFTNPNLHALFLLPAFCAFFIEIDIKLKKDLSFKSIKYLVLGMALCISQIIMTECRAAILAVSIISILYIAAGIINKKSKKKFIGIVCLNCMIFIVSLPLTFFTFRYIPALVHNPLIYKSEYQCLDKMITSSDSITSKKYATFSNFLSELGGRINKKGDVKYISTNIDYINSISTNRLTIYKEYLKQITFQGHTELGININGVLIPHAHNSFIHVMYKYGVIPGILFTLFSFVSFIYSIKNIYCNSDDNEYNLFPFFIITCFLIVSLFDYISTPFLPIGFYFWSVQASLFRITKKNN